MVWEAQPKAFSAEPHGVAFTKQVCLPNKIAQAAATPQVEQTHTGVDKWAPLSNERWKCILESMGGSATTRFS